MQHQSHLHVCASSARLASPLARRPGRNEQTSGTTHDRLSGLWHSRAALGRVWPPSGPKPIDLWNHPRETSGTTHGLGIPQRGWPLRLPGDEPALSMKADQLADAYFQPTADARERTDSFGRRASVQLVYWVLQLSVYAPAAVLVEIA